MIKMICPKEKKKRLDSGLKPEIGTLALNKHMLTFSHKKENYIMPLFEKLKHSEIGSHKHNMVNIEKNK